MKFKEFIGIDVSKSKIDVFIYSLSIYNQFDNNSTGFNKMVRWINKTIGQQKTNILYAFEHTGLYSLSLSVFLDEKKEKFTVIPGLELKRSRGIARGKSDNIDARAIAEYAYEKRERIKLYEVPSPTLLKIKRLLSYRERLVSERAGAKGRINEYKKLLDQKENEKLFNLHAELIAHLDYQIKEAEKELNKLIQEDENLAKQYKLINSIKGLGPQAALLMITITNGFTSFNEWRKFASYSGTAPFPNQSGTFKGRTRVSNLANKRMKAILSCCANSAIQHNPEMKLYYKRRIAEGKNEMSTLNIVRNKLISRAFAVIKRGTPYVETYGYAA